MVSEGTANKVIWNWTSDPFGSTVPNEDPDGDGVKFAYNLRFPGQYYDRETGLHYNYFRDYDPRIGRYVESDPVGLRGGVNTYLYGKGDPVNKSDPSGLLVCGAEDSLSKYLIPDFYFIPAPFIGFFNFTSCCQGHDDCYGKACKKTKDTCDGDFYQCMMKECASAGLAYVPCAAVARGYYEAVDKIGNAAFNDARKKCKDCLR